MRKKHQRTLNRIFQDPVQSSIAWRDIESLFDTLGANIEEGAGSRVVIELSDTIAVFHRPHPEKETDKGAVKSVRRYLISIGVEPC